MMQHNIKKVTLAVAAALLSGAACAGTQIPLTVEDALRVAAADQQNSIEVGARTVQANGSGTTAFNAWNGAEESKSSLDADIHLQGGDGAHNWSIQGRDIGTEIPEMHAEYNTVGTFGVEADYKRFRHLSYADEPLFGSDGSSRGHKTMDQVRDVYKVGAFWLPMDSLDLRADYQLDDRRGAKHQNLMSYQWGGATTYASDIDDQHHQVNVSAEWAYNSVSLEANYYYSKYENNKPRLIRGPQVGVALDPSNSLHRVGLDGLWQISDTSTLSVSAGYGWNKLEENSFENVYGYQDPNYDIETKIPTFDVAYAARPLQNLSFSAKYGYRKYDNSADSHGFTYSNHSYSHWDTSRTENKLALDAIYDFGKGYSAKAWTSMLDKSYEMTIKGNTEWKGGLEFRKRMSSTLNGKIAYQYTNRTAEDWRASQASADHKEFWNASFWSLAAYEEHELKFDLNSNITDSLTLGFYGSLYTRDYSDTEGKYYGVDDSKGYRLGLDSDWTISRDWSVFAFYDFDYQKMSVHTSQSLGSDSTMKEGSLGGTKDVNHTFGLGVDLHPELQPWALKIQYVYGFDKTETDRDPSAPDAEYKTHYAEATGEWRVNKDWALEGSVLYGKVDSSDYMREVINDGSMSNPVQQPNYSAALFYLGVKYNLPM